MPRIFNDQQENAASDTYTWFGGFGTFCSCGMWDGASISLQMSPDDGETWIDISDDVTHTHNAVGSFRLPVCQLRAELSNAGGATSLSAMIMN